MLYHPIPLLLKEGIKVLGAFCPGKVLGVFCPGKARYFSTYRKFSKNL
jgi:hypothetical protein